MPSKNTNSLAIREVDFKRLITKQIDLEGKIYVEFNVGDIVRTKKEHPCGSKLWEITRVGVDFKLSCLGCGHTIMLERPKALKMIVKKVQRTNLAE